jgi:hypothetical protein
MTTTIVVSALVGIGLNVSIISTVDHAFFGPLPYRGSDALVPVVSSGVSGAPVPFLTEREATAVRSFSDLFESTATIECWPASRRARMDYLDRDGASRRVNAALITPKLFTLLGVQVECRNFSSADGARGANVAILDGRFATERFGTSAIGASIRLSGTWFDVIGVLPSSFKAPLPSLPSPYERFQRIDVWILQDPSELRGGTGDAFHYVTLGRIRQDLDRSSAQRELIRRMQGVGRDPDSSYLLEPLRDAMLGSSGYIGFVLLSLLGLLLMGVSLINLLMMFLVEFDAARRRRALLLALGASPLRLSIHAVLEFLILVVPLSAAAAVVGVWGQSWLERLLPHVPWPVLQNAFGNWRAAAAAFAMMVVASVVAFLCVARRPADVEDMRMLAGTGERATGRISRADRLILACQIACVIALVTPAAGLSWALARSTRAQVDAQSDQIVGEALLVERLYKSKSLRPVRRRSFHGAPGVEALGWPAVLGVGRRVGAASGDPVVEPRAPAL